MPHASLTPELRRARSSDAQALWVLQDEIYREGRWFVGNGPPSVGSLQRQLRGLDESQSLYLVAAQGAAVYAWLELHRLQPARLNHVAMLTLAVAQRQRRHGLGRRLLRRGFDWARRVGVAKISLNVRAGNLAAISLYRDCGFVEEGRERSQIRCDGGFEDNLVMAAFVDEAGRMRSVEGDRAG